MSDLLRVSLSTIESVSSSDDEVAHFVYDLTTSETKEEILVLLSNVKRKFGHGDQDQHDAEVGEGMAAQLALSLHKLLLSKPLSQKQHYRTTLEPTRQLQATVLCVAIDMVLQCSNEVLQQHIVQLSKNLAPPLPRLVTMLSMLKSNPIVRLTTLSTCIRIMRRVGPLLPQAIVAFACSLLLLLEKQIPSDIRVEAACAVTAFLACNSTRKDDLHRVVNDNSSVLISIISTGAMAASEEDTLDCLLGLCNLGRDPKLCAKLIKRRCVILAIKKHLVSEHSQVRYAAFDLCRALVRMPQQNSATPTIIAENMALLTGSLIKVSLCMDDPNEHANILGFLQSIIRHKLVDEKHVQSVLNTMYLQAVSDVPEPIAIQAGIFYLEHSSFASEMLANVVHLTASPYSKVRAAALDVLHDMTFWNIDVGETLLYNTELLNIFSTIVSSGSQSDCTSAVTICKQLLFHNVNHIALCKHKPFMSSLVSLVTTEPIQNRVAHAHAVTMILELTTSKTHASYFASHPRLLPWLVQFANRTSDDDMKKEAVNSILHFTTAFTVK